LDSLTRGQRGGSPTYSHGRGLPWLQLNAGRQGISYGGAEAQRANDHWPGLTLLPMILLLFSWLRVRPFFPNSRTSSGIRGPARGQLGVSPTFSHIKFPARSFIPSSGLGVLREDLVCGRRRIRADLRDSRACSKTAEDCRGYNAPPSRPRASVRNPCFFYTIAASSISWLRVRAPGLLGRFGITENRLDW
jgi:hypothetical protein